MDVIFWRRVAAIAAVCCGFAQFAFADDGVSRNLAEDSIIQPVAFEGSTQSCHCDHGCEDSGCDCEAHAKCEPCSCYLCGPDEPVTLMSLLPENECRRWNVGGWLQFGYHSNERPLSNNRGDLLSFNDLPGDLNTHQAWLYIEREADGECGWDWGYRADIMYGADAQKTQAFGNPLDAAGNIRHWDNDLDHGGYGWAIPQAYVQVANGDLSIIAGHFYTLIGYEYVTAPDNFFYSHDLGFFNSEPFTHTGVLGTYKVNDNVEVYGGWTLGWDTGFDQFGSGSSWLGGVSFTMSDSATVTYISTAGNLGWRGRDGYSHSIVFEFDVTDRLEWVVQSDLVSIVPDDINGGSNNDQVNLNQYLFYSLNDCWKIGGRFEWWKSDGVSFNEITLGVNYRPHANLVFRPEWRMDFDNETVVTPDTNRSTFGIDAVITF